MYNEWFNQRFHRDINRAIDGRSIAVVGNGASLLAEENGKEIESHDFIVRFGKGVPDKFNEPSIGRRTDLWVFAAFRASKDLYKRFSPRFAMMSLAQIGLYEKPTSIVVPDACLNGDLQVYTHFGLLGSVEDHLLWSNMINTSTGRPSQGAMFVGYMLQQKWHLRAKRITFYGFDFFNSTFDMKGKPTASWHCPILRKDIKDIPHDSEAEERFIRGYASLGEHIKISESKPITQERANAIIEHYRGKK